MFHKIRFFYTMNKNWISGEHVKDVTWSTCPVLSQSHCQSSTLSILMCKIRAFEVASWLQFAFKGLVWILVSCVQSFSHDRRRHVFPQAFLTTEVYADQIGYTQILAPMVPRQITSISSQNICERAEINGVDLELITTSAENGVSAFPLKNLEANSPLCGLPGTQNNYVNVL